MTTFAIGGQSSGDFRETSGRVQLFHVVTRNSVGLLSPDGFTQANPPGGLAIGATSTTLASITKVGVLGGSVAFTRRDIGNNYIGGPKAASAAASGVAAGILPLGIFLNDALGNAFENTPGVASGRAPYVTGSGSCVGVSIYETKVQSGGFAALTYAVGDKLYASINGLLTNTIADSLDSITPGVATVIGIVKVAPDANSSLLVLDLRV
jgi:hypothetical protein